MESKDYRYETFRLKTVLNEIEKQIKKGKDALELIKETQITAQKTAWDELPRFVTSFDDLVEISTQVAGDKSVYEYYRLSQNTLGRLEKMALSPYLPGSIFHLLNYPVPLPVARQTAFQARLIHLSGHAILFRCI